VRRRIQPLRRDRLIDRSNSKRAVPYAHQRVGRQYDFLKPSHCIAPKRKPSLWYYVHSVSGAYISRDYRTVRAALDSNMRRSYERIVDDHVVVIRAT
jgi:hypothetical protein